MSAAKDRIAIYTAEGWVTEPADLDYARIVRHAIDERLRLDTARDVLDAATSAYGWSTRGGPFRGQRYVEDLAPGGVEWIRRRAVDGTFAR